MWSTAAGHGVLGWTWVVTTGVAVYKAAVEVIRLASAAFEGDDDFDEDFDEVFEDEVFEDEVTELG